jgi:hypothetical protein
VCLGVPELDDMRSAFADWVNTRSRYFCSSYARKVIGV